jgi:hypothetical protein
MELDGKLNVKGGLKVGTGGQIGGGAYTLDYYQPNPVVGVATGQLAIGTNTSGSVAIFPFHLPCPVNVGMMGLNYSLSYSTIGNSSYQETGVWYAGIYSRQTGSATSHLSLAASAAFSFSITGSNSSYTFRFPTSTTPQGFVYGSTASAGSDITTLMTGQRVVHYPMNTVLTAGHYWLAHMAIRSSTSTNLGMRAFILGPAPTLELQIAPIGSYSISVSTGTRQIEAMWHLRYVHGTYTPVAVSSLPNEISISNVNGGGGVNTIIPFMVLWSTR